jgi:hypothetical protein
VPLWPGPVAVDEPEIIKMCTMSQRVKAEHQAPAGGRLSPPVSRSLSTRRNEGVSASGDFKFSESSFWHGPGAPVTVARRSGHDFLQLEWQVHIMIDLLSPGPVWPRRRARTLLQDWRHLGNRWWRATLSRRSSVTTWGGRLPDVRAGRYPSLTRSRTACTAAPASAGDHRTGASPAPGPGLGCTTGAGRARRLSHLRLLDLKLLMMMIMIMMPALGPGPTGKSLGGVTVTRPGPCDSCRELRVSAELRVTVRHSDGSCAAGGPAGPAAAREA